MSAKKKKPKKKLDDQDYSRWRVHGVEKHWHTVYLEGGDILVSVIGNLTGPNTKALACFIANALNKRAGV